MDLETEEELKNFKVDKQVKSIHLSLEDTRQLQAGLRKAQNLDWVWDAQIVDYLITFLRQYKSAVNIIKKLKQLENIECKFILVLSKEVSVEYSKNLPSGLKKKFKEWFQKMLKGFCNDNRIN